MTPPYPQAPPPKKHYTGLVAPEKRGPLCVLLLIITAGLWWLLGTVLSLIVIGIAGVVTIIVFAKLTLRRWSYSRHMTLPPPL